MTDASQPRDGTSDAAASSAVERSISPIAGRLSSGFGGKAVVLAALVVGCGVFVAATWGKDKTKSDSAPVQPARQVVPFEPLRTASAPTLTAPGAGAPELTPAADGRQVPALEPSSRNAADPAAQRRAELAEIRGAPILAFSRGGGLGGATDVPRPLLAAAPVEGAEPTELDQLRRGSTIGRARAARVGDRNFLILAGASIPCILQTAMDTAAPGYVSCLIPRDIYSDNGAVVLMEKGTRVLGEYRSGMRQGQKRLFVLWTRAVTPAGVAISVGSPATDPVGRAGFGGDIDTHFWDRFGGALLLSVVDDGVYAVAGNSSNQYGTIRLPSDTAGIALQGSINIPPTLTKPQGAEVSILVAQDFDFSGVYGLKAR
ncbi:MAG: type IV secretion system protein VirB10 [Caulobacteraceae bacterium]|nr:type IV secretion system protein VirB10 [Caulobacteraceae bacterium]